MNCFRCIHCRETLTRDLVAIGVRSCGRCAVLLAQLGDTVVPPPEGETGCDDVRPPAIEHKPIRDGKWLAWAAAKRGQMRFFQDYGQICGLPLDMRQWSPGQVEQAVEAIQSKKAKA